MYHTAIFDVYDTSVTKELFSYFDRLTAGAKCMYNVANFHIRQLMTGLKKKPSERTPNEQSVIDKVAKYLPLINDGIAERNRKRAANGKKLTKPFAMPTAKKSFVGKNFLVAIFAMDNDPDYRSLYSQAAQNTVGECVEAWKSFFALKKAGVTDAKIPRYKKKDHASVTFSSQGCRIENGMLRLPGTKIRFDVGSFPHHGDKLIEVRIVPYFGHYQIHILTDDLAEEPEKKDPCEPRNAMMIDLGVDNFAAITDSIGRTPIAVKGGYLKSINQNWNRMNAKLKSILMKGHDPKTYHPENTKHMNAISAKRDRIFRDMFYKISHFICRVAVSRGIDMIIVGRNTGWKQNADMGHKNNQTFVQIPHAQFIHALRVTAVKYGIEVFEQEESYTSRSSFIDDDPIPTYGNPESPYISLSGRRAKRGLYRTADGTLINADVNGALNIGRKYDPWMFENMTSDTRKRYASSTAVVGYRALHPESKGK